jgi:hypothetical protein
MTEAPALNYAVIHGEIYRARADVLPIVHSHSPWVCPSASSRACASGQRWCMDRWTVTFSLCFRVLDDPDGDRHAERRQKA